MGCGCKKKKEQVPTTTPNQKTKLTENQEKQVQRILDRIKSMN
jgi:hypothetical protein